MSSNIYEQQIVLAVDAIEICSNEHVDLILLDVMMPELDATKDMPIIFVSAKVALDDEKKGLRLGAIDYITKPTSPESYESSSAPGSSWRVGGPEN